MNFTFNTVPDIIFRSGVSKEFGAHAKTRMKRPILLTDKGLIEAGLVEPVLASLKKENLDVFLFDDVAADPPAPKVKEAIEAAREHKADGVIGVGGGSSMDTAKLVAVLMNSEQSLEDIYGTDQVTGAR